MSAFKNIFISYRQKDNKGDRWVCEFVEALKFAGLQAKVVLAARSEEKLNSIDMEIRLKGGEALIIPCDSGIYDDALQIARETILQWGKADTLIACAGKYVQDQTHEVDFQSFEESVAVNFYGTLNIIKSVLPEMKRRGSGHIVIVNSLDAKKGTPAMEKLRLTPLKPGI